VRRACAVARPRVDSCSSGTEVNHDAPRGSGVSGNAVARRRKYFRCRRQSSRICRHLARSESVKV
jgi:hypothetical protein